MATYNTQLPYDPSTRFSRTALRDFETRHQEFDEVTAWVVVVMNPSMETTIITQLNAESTENPVSDCNFIKYRPIDLMMRQPPVPSAIATAQVNCPTSAPRRRDGHSESSPNVAFNRIFNNRPYGQ